MISNVLQGKQERLSIYGKDYPTKDGTAVRDYIHVMDIARAHLHAYEYITAFHESSQEHTLQKGLHEVFNLSTGEGASVLEVIQTVETVTQKAVPYNYGPRRAGDPAIVIGNANKAEKLLGRRAEHDIMQAIQDHRKYLQQ